MCWYSTKKAGSNLGIARGVWWEYSELVRKELNLTGTMKLKKKQLRGHCGKYSEGLGTW